MMNIFDELQNLPDDWKYYLDQEFNLPYMQNLQQFIADEVSRGKTIYPEMKDIYNAFHSTSLKNVKVVIIGQDPYHGEGQAHGLSFSVKNDIKIPPSLKNIYKQISTEFGYDLPRHGNLGKWAKQGVLLLNSVLTVEKAAAGSHQKKGWEIFTDKVVNLLNEHRENIVFILWGSHAQKKGQKIDESKHLVLKSAHPSPLSAYRGFFGCNHFSLANDYLIKHNKQAIDWRIN